MRHSDTKKAMSLKQRAFLKHFADTEPRFNVSAACKRATVSRATVYRWRADDPLFKEAYDDIQELRFDEIETALHNKAVAECDTTALIFLSKTLLKQRGYVEGHRTTVSETNSVVQHAIDQFLDSEISLENAALKITKAGLPLPKIFEILLARKPEEVSEENYAPSVEEIERKAAEALAAAMAQREYFLPKRQKEVRQLKESLKNLDSFNAEEDDR